MATVSRYRTLKGIPRFLLIVSTALGIGLAVYYIFNFSLSNLKVMELGYHYLLIALFLPFAFLLLPFRKGETAATPWYDIILALLAFATPFYLFLRANDVLLQAWAARAPIEGLIAGAILWFLPLEAARRAAGLPMTVIALILSVYPLFAPYMPGILVGPPIDFDRLISYHAFSSESILGIPMWAFGRIIVGYLVFASALVATGGGQFFINFALGLLGHVRGGPAKVAVAASALLGTLSGSAVVNVVTTGTITIPTMKKTGYPGYYAGAIEACASTGGILMPPVMGAVAFIMAALLGVPYADIVIAAIVPATLYYLALFVQADFYAAKTGLRGLPRNEIPSLSQTLKDGWYFIFAILLLIFFLFYLRLEAMAPFYATGALFLMAFVRRQTRPTPTSFVRFLQQTGTSIVEIVSILVPIGLILGALAVTGLAYSLSSGLVSITGGNLALLLILGALASYIMGMGATITACYVFLALTVSPVLIGLGIDPIAAHLFVMYGAMLSSITPPVALASYVAATVAEAPFMKTAMQAVRLGAMLFVLPFFFVLKPEFILKGSPLAILEVVVTAVLGIIIAAAGLEGYLWKVGRLSNPVRFLFFGAGILILVPIMWTEISGAILFVAVLPVLLLRRKASAAPEVDIAASARVPTDAPE